MSAESLGHLAKLLKARNTIDAEIAALIGRPPEKGHLGEYIAARVFRIQLMDSAAYKGIDGHFSEGALAGKSVNIKYYGKREGLLAMSAVGSPDYYLVLAGPKSSALSSKGLTRPFVITSVYLFAHEALVAAITAKLDPVATSVRAHLWQAAEVYPVASNAHLPLTDEQRDLLALFAPSNS
jgi:hypothetical protein